MPSADREPLTYRAAGVDIDRGTRLVERIKHLAARTQRPGVVAGVGGFGALFELPVDRYREPLLVSGADGIGTKLKLAVATGRHDTVGVDLVAMCANDILTLGAEPLFFLDYFASGRLELEVAEAVVAGIAEGCAQAGAALIGGETAEMPGLYAPGDYDLAGFCVGVVEKSRVIDGREARAGDAIIGVASSGLHSNGFSLVRRVLEARDVALDSPFAGRSLAEALLEPTRIYVRPVLALIEALPVRAIAHVTGGGLPENVPRALPPGLCARLDPDAWPRPPVFEWLASKGDIAESEMWRTFNCGIGLVLVVADAHAEQACACLESSGERGFVIGRLEAAEGPARVVIA